MRYAFACCADQAGLIRKGGDIADLTPWPLTCSSLGRSADTPPPPRLERVIFDLDGVLPDRAEYHYPARKGLADEQGIPFDSSVSEKSRGVSRVESLQIILRHARKSLPAEEGPRSRTARTPATRIMKGKPRGRRGCAGGPAGGEDGGEIPLSREKPAGSAVAALFGVDRGRHQVPVEWKAVFLQRMSVPTDEGNSLVSLRDKATVGEMAAIRVIGLEVLRLSMGQSMDAAGMMIMSQAVVPNQLNSTSPRSSFPLARREGCMLSVKRSDISQQFLGDIQGFHRIFP